MLVQSSACSSPPGFDPETWRTSFRLWGRSETQKHVLCGDGRGREVISWLPPQVRDVRMISDRSSRRSKGIAYIEFVEASSVPLAIGLTGQRLLGVPIIVQASQAEKNRAAAAAAAAAAANNLQKGMMGPLRLYVGSLHFNITEEMLRGIFEPFGRVRRTQAQAEARLV